MDTSKGTPIVVLFADTTPFFGALMRVHSQVIKHLDASRFRTILASFRHSDYGNLPAEVPHLKLVKYYRDSSTTPGKDSSGPLGPLFVSLRRAGAFLKAARDARREGVAIVHVGMTGGMVVAGAIIATLSGAKLVVHSHADPWQASKLRRVLFKIVLRRAAAVITVSWFVKDRTAALGIPPNKMHPILNTVDLERFHPKNSGDAIRQEYGVPADAPLVVCLGRLFPGKGQHFLVAAMVAVRKEAPDVRTLLIGWQEPRRGPGGTFRSLLDHQVDEGGLSGVVRIDDARPEADAIMAAADVVAVPSTDDPCPLTVLEAMASGKPVVGFRSGGIPEEVGDDGGAILVEPGDVAGLADALLTLARDPALRQSMGARNRKRAETLFYERRLAEETMGVYDAVLADSRPAGAGAAGR